jgi:zinc transporter ZupT
MLYVSFVEIFVKSVDAFTASLGDRWGYVAATGSLFGGMLVMKGVEVLVDYVDSADKGDSGGSRSGNRSGNSKKDDGDEHAHTHDCGHHIPPTSVDEWVTRAEVEISSQVSSQVSSNPPRSNSMDSDAGGFFSFMSLVVDTNDADDASDTLASSTHNPVPTTSPATSPASSRANSRAGAASTASKIVTDAADYAADDADNDVENAKSSTISLPPTTPPSASSSASSEDNKLIQMGLTTALSIAIHNFPEGLATYVAAIADPKVGATLALAIAIHNVPEGLCVSIPVYYATKDRYKAFRWGILSGLTEPIGALAGYLILAETMSELVYGTMFGLVSGMMIRISIKELLPTAQRYDVNDKVTSKGVVAGMATMAASLVMFKVV